MTLSGTQEVFTIFLIRYKMYDEHMSDLEC